MTDFGGIPEMPEEGKDEFDPTATANDYSSADGQDFVTGADGDNETLRLRLLETDRQLIANGYEPIAVFGKRPVADGWQRRPNTIEAITAERAANPWAIGTGIRTGRPSGVDIDLIPPEHAKAIKQIAFEVLGETKLERIGSKGMLLCYRNETPIPKITISGKHTVLAEVVNDEVKPLRARWRSSVSVSSSSPMARTRRPAGTTDGKVPCSTRSPWKSRSPSCPR